MKIAAHRGHWLHPAEKNSMAAFERALQGGFGIETDLRDAGGAVVISHDPARGGEMTLDDFLALCARHPEARPLALNIKADGLQALVQRALHEHAITQAFVFDMALPDALGYLRLSDPAVATFTRCSEYENPPAYGAAAAGLWLDAFHGQWYDMAQLELWLAQHRHVCIVSPELHGRPHRPFWQQLRDAGLQQHAGLSLCTDFPLEAKEFFRV